MENPLLGIVVGALFTGLVQSSAATMSIAIVMSLDGLITLPAAVALSLGANVGTCVTAGLAALGKPVAAVRAAAAHVAFNIAGVLLWVWFIPELIAITVRLSPPDLPRQIANANSLFNVINTVLFLPFAGLVGGVAGAVDSRARSAKRIHRQTQIPRHRTGRGTIPGAGNRARRAPATWASGYYRCSNPSAKHSPM